MAWPLGEVNSCCRALLLVQRGHWSRGQDFRDNSKVFITVAHSGQLTIGLVKLLGDKCVDHGLV
jgi:hypothetical protein